MASARGRDRAPLGTARHRTTLRWEIKLGHPTLQLVGVDEVGRGCLAGPVVAAAVALPAVVSYKLAPWLREVTDSKRLPPEARVRLAAEIELWARAWAVGVASVEEIDTINIYHASHLAMCRAIAGVREKLTSHILHVLIDGNVVPKNLGPVHGATAVVKGDLQCLSIAAGSILAKVWRDRHMAELEAEHPGYGFAQHKGYGTPEHLIALAERGVCVLHRRSFAPVAARVGAAAASGPAHATGNQGSLRTKS